MYKKGQITFIVIAGIILLVIIGGIFLGRINTIPTIKLKESEIEDVKVYVQNCVSQTFEDGIKFLGSGGYENYEEA